MWLIIWKCEALTDLSSLLIIKLFCADISSILKEVRNAALYCSRRRLEALFNPFSIAVKWPKVTAFSRPPSPLCVVGARERCFHQVTIGRCKWSLWVSVLALCSSLCFLVSLIYSLSSHLLSAYWVLTVASSGQGWAFIYIISPQPLKVGIVNVPTLQVGTLLREVKSFRQLEVSKL